jgi:hypothetical protein
MDSERARLTTFIYLYDIRFYMDYKCVVDKKARELRIVISGEPSELYRCGRVIVDICEGDESPRLMSHFDSAKELSDIISPITVPVGCTGMEIFKFSNSRLEYSFSLNGHPKDKIKAVRTHYETIHKELNKLMKYFNGSPAEYDSRFFNSI